jgi:hypothetical protein
MPHNLGRVLFLFGSGPAACYLLPAACCMLVLLFAVLTAVRTQLEHYLFVRASKQNIRRIEGAVDAAVQHQPPRVSNGEALPCDDEILSGKRCDVM